jgi:hypothetical protein
MKVFSRVQEALVLALMLVVFLAIFSTNIDFTLKIGIGVIAAAIVFLATLAAGLLQQQKEMRRA